MGNYTEDDLRNIFNEIRSASFDDIFDKTRLIFKKFRVFGYASPFTLNIFINIKQINKYKWPEDAVRGLFAHELSHQVSYKRRSFVGRMLFIWNYPFSGSRRRKVEEEGDEIVIERGYGKELVQERIYQFKIDDKKRIKKEKKVYLSVDALEKLIKKKRLTN